MNARFVQRMPDELHERIKRLANEYGTSVNGLINTTMKEMLESDGVQAIERRVAELEKEMATMKKNNRVE